MTKHVNSTWSFLCEHKTNQWPKRVVSFAPRFMLATLFFCTGKKKKGKAKSQGKKGTISLNEFLADGPTTSNTPPFRTKSWADESEELNDDGMYSATINDFTYLLLELSTQWPESDRPKPQVNRSSLPSAPRASTVPNIDMTRLPKNPPYTVFLGNLSYEANEEDISKFFERHKLIVSWLII